VAAIAITLMVTEQRMLFLVGGVALWRSLQRETGPGDTRAFGTFVVLVFALSLLARGVTPRLYVPYGRDWFRYWMRRVAESQGAG